MSETYPVETVAMINWHINSDGEVLAVRMRDGWYVPLTGIRWTDAQLNMLKGFSVRRLAVIDSEDDADLKQLIFASDTLTGLATGPYTIDSVVAELRSAFRTYHDGRVTEEPTGLGAAVADVSGNTWVRAGLREGDSAPWLRVDVNGDAWVPWQEIRATEVLGEGTHKR